MNLAVFATIIVSCICICLPKSKVACILMFVFMWSLWGFNLWNGDYVSYMKEYDNPSWDTVEIGYRILCEVFSAFLPFQGFLLIISSFVLGFFCFYGIKYTKYPGIYALIYYPMFILEYVYFRNFICNAIIVYALFRIIFEHKSANISYILIVLATTVHIFSICYLPIVFLLNSRIKQKQFIFVVIILSVLALIASQTIIHSIGYIESKSQFYARPGGNSLSLTTLFHIVVVIISNYILRRSRLKVANTKSTVKYFCKYNIASLLFIPIYYLMPYAASRSLRLLLLMNFIFYLYILFSSTTNTKIYSKLGIMFVCLCLGYFFSIQRFEFVLFPLYYCNLIWGYDGTYQLINY